MTRSNPIDTTFYNETQREELNEAIEEFYEDYAERLVSSGSNPFNTFIGNPGISYGLIDAKATTLEGREATPTPSAAR